MSKQKKTVEIICILDRSGSMATLADEVIGSFNTFVDEQKKDPSPAKLTLVLFDDQYDVVYDRVDLQKVQELTKTLYFARGMTALNDAIGKTINDDKFKKTKKAICLVQTDGHENASQEYKGAQIKELVEKKQKAGWDFVFAGANIDAFAVGSTFGLNINQTVQFDPTKKGLRSSYGLMGASVTSYRST